jgi:hypothetical protein
MEHAMRRLVAVIPALALVAGLGLAARPPAPADEHSGICVGSMQIVACVPPDGTQP